MEESGSVGSAARRGVLVVLILYSAFGLQAQKEPSHTPASAVIVDTDDPCRLKVDDDDEGVITPARGKKIDVVSGEHILKCIVEDVPDLVWRKVVDVKTSQQAAALVVLKALHIQYDDALRKATHQKETVGAVEQRRRNAEELRATFSGRWAAVSGSVKKGFIQELTVSEGSVRCQHGEAARLGDITFYFDGRPSTDQNGIHSEDWSGAANWNGELLQINVRYQRNEYIAHFTFDFSVSADGRRLTQKMRVVNSNGQLNEGTHVYERST
jgi:hypothetical protein